MADDPFDPRLVEAGRAARTAAEGAGASLPLADAAQAAAIGRLRWALLAERWTGSDRERALAESRQHADHLASIAARLGRDLG
jgi:hypothetical protein